MQVVDVLVIDVLVIDVQVIDVLVIGGGPAALAMAAALGAERLKVVVLSPNDPSDAWANTYGIWGEEVDALGLAHLLGHRWSHSVGFFGAGEADADGPANAPTVLGRDYGLFDKHKLQTHWLQLCQQAGVIFQRGTASGIGFIDGDGLPATADTPGSRCRVCGPANLELTARLVVDASGHQPVFVTRADEGPVAGQAAYGLVGRFSAAPVEPGEFVLMDFRCDHLTPAERLAPPTFLYAMDLGDGLFFVEETSLALAPPVPVAELRQRLERRLAHRGVALLELHHEEFCLFPMNLPLPHLDQPVLAFGGAAAMVHPASGYLVGALLRRAGGLAKAIAAELKRVEPTSVAALAAAGWQALWPAELRRKHALYTFGLEKLMRFREDQLRHFFATFFSLPGPIWYGFLTNTLPLPELIWAMLRLFLLAPWDVRWGLMRQRGRELSLAWRLLVPAPPKSTRPS
jgi:lycopene cyclase-like protein